MIEFGERRRPASLSILSCVLEQHLAALPFARSLSATMIDQHCAEMRNLIAVASVTVT
jgi:hypothetical protein